MPDRITILLADDHPLMRLALRSIIEKEADLEVIAEANDGEEAVTAATELVPDVVIMDIMMPRLNGLEATRRIKEQYPNIAVLVLTIHSDREHIFGILEAGAAGYLTKRVFGEEVVSAIRGVVAGDAVLSRDVLRQLLKDSFRYSTKPLPVDNVETLTSREQQVLKLAARGMSNKEIAQNLGLSTRTIKSYLVDMFTKLRVGSRTEAVITGLQAGLLSLDDLS